jgi:hypothetical protein
MMRVAANHCPFRTRRSIAGGLVMVTEVPPSNPSPDVSEMAPANYVDLIRRNRSFRELAAFRSLDANLTGIDDPERVNGYRVTARRSLSISPYHRRRRHWVAHQSQVLDLRGVLKAIADEERDMLLRLMGEQVAQLQANLPRMRCRHIREPMDVRVLDGHGESGESGQFWKH